ncbi:MAG TPA: Gfo/Idh/MocA family oxidoreductase [Candidatus Woesebacteria bacterium]|nr:Gfo/Idh/MocA family oxidoreductase [Candidatus Woesebacteria bacterium]
MFLSKAKILLVGCGPHARRIYLPALKSSQDKIGTELKAVVELQSKEEETISIVNKYFASVEYLFIKPFNSRLELPILIQKSLNAIVKKNEINGVIIATDPTNHMQYALWAEKQGLHILMDKPISTHQNAANSVNGAKMIATDFELLQSIRQPNLAFIINSQRRYSPGHQIMQEKINEIAEKYSMPVTSMQTTHCDGQFRLPNEIINLNYHGYHGYGKVSHSGYHFIDMSSLIIENSFKKAKKKIDKLSVFSQFIRPSGLLKQQNQEDFKKLFKNYSDISPQTDKQIIKSYIEMNEAEVDAFSNITYYSEGIPVSNVSLNLIHNGFSRRSNLIPNLEDLYKGNGRLRHEYYNIQQGPLQNIQIHSYQSKSEQDGINNDRDFELGGNNHFDIYIFRNANLIGGKILEVISARDFSNIYNLDKEKLINELARINAINDFIEIIIGKRKSNETASDLSKHKSASQIMSLIYQSGINNKIISIQI